MTPSESAMPPLDSSHSEGSVTPVLSVSTPTETMTSSMSATPPQDSSQSEGSVTPPLSVSTPPQTLETFRCTNAKRPLNVTQ